MYSLYGKSLPELKLPFLQVLDEKKKNLIIEVLEKDVNCPLSCSAGRWFDAVAAITGVCTEAGFHAEAPMRLEACIDRNEPGSYPWEINSGNTIEFDQLVKAIIEDINSNVPVSIISARFHNSIAGIVIGQINSLSIRSGIKKAVISGGSFQNKFLLAKLEKEYKRGRVKLYSQSRIPSNDGGIALGQLAIAAKIRGGNL